MSKSSYRHLPLSARMIWFRLIPVFIFVFAHIGWAAEPASESSCVACHSDIWHDVQGSVHGKNGISCQHCHGGDPKQPDKDLAKKPETGYVGIPNKKQTVETCGKCHSDVAFMNFYGTRTDQLAQYKTSMHGKKLLIDGDARVAACTDCHGYHDVVAVTDPNSPVYPLNLPKTCNRCHGNQKLMADHQLPSDIFEKYKNSVHGQALFEKKDISVAQCASCHGSHGAVPPGVKDVSATCGKCHINEKKYFLESVHAQVMSKGKFSECMSCHSNHDVKHPGIFLYQEACLKCHETGSKAFQEGKAIGHLMDESEEKLHTAEALVKQASIEGIFVEEEAASLEEAKTDMIALAPLQHTLSLDKLSEHSKKLIQTTDEISQNIHKKRQFLKWRKFALVPIWIFIIVMASALWAKYKQIKALHDEDKRKE